MNFPLSESDLNVVVRVFNASKESIQLLRQDDFEFIRTIITNQVKLRKAKLQVFDINEEFSAYRKQVEEVAKQLVPSSRITPEPEKPAPPATFDANLGNSLSGRSIADLMLGTKANNALLYAEIKTLLHVVQKTEAELLKIQNVGRKSVDLIKAELLKRNLRLGMTLE